MKVELPNGCNIYYGTYIDNYNGGIRTRYYIREGELIANNRTNANLPTGAMCMTNELIYGEQFSLGMGLAISVVVALIFGIITKIILGRFIK